MIEVKYMRERIPLIEIDVSNVENMRELHELLKDKLEFPSFYGMNWDAFWDAITGLVEMPETLIFEGWKNLKERMPQDSKIMVELLESFNEKYKKWGCKVEYR
jgi:RNAse (barnase) inhibitor barstar